MRYALRKQDKIKAVLGKESLENNILQSLNKYFGNNDDDRIYSDIEPDGYVTDYALDDDEKGTHGGPNGYISCEGRCCQEAYEMYIEEWTE